MRHVFEILGSIRRRLEPGMLRVARVLRANMTDAERRLWRRLRESNSRGYSFRRQAPFREYVLDFCEHRARVVIELDGSQHAEEDHRLKDAARDAVLASQGYLVLRFWNHDAHTNIDGIVEAIERALTRDRDTPGRP